jgi:hypothetical protein
LLSPDGPAITGTSREEDGAVTTACRVLRENSNERIAMKARDGGFVAVTRVAKAEFF